MEHTKYSLQSILKIALGIVFGVWLMMCAPTGWIYDLWVGAGTGQGQMPDPSVSVVHTQADVEDSYFQNTPITTSKEGLIEAPLLRLRDTEYAGEHTSRRNGVRRSVTISEYIPTADLTDTGALILRLYSDSYPAKQYRWLPILHYEESIVACFTGFIGIVRISLQNQASNFRFI